MLFDTCEEIVLINKSAKDFKNFEFEVISNFSMTSPISASEFEEIDENGITKKLYSDLLNHYNNKCQDNANSAYPVIREVFERPDNKFERIVVPFSDGVKSLNVVTDLKQAYQTNGKSLDKWLWTKYHISNNWQLMERPFKEMDELKQSVN